MANIRGHTRCIPPSPSIIRIDCFLIIDLTAKSSTNPPPPHVLAIYTGIGVVTGGGIYVPLPPFIAKIDIM